MTRAANLVRNAEAVVDCQQQGINVLDTPDEYYTMFIDAQNEVIQDMDDEFLARVYQSQENFADTVYPYHSRTVTLYDRVIRRAEAARETGAN